MGVHVAWMDGRMCQSAVFCRSLVLIETDGLTFWKKAMQLWFSCIFARSIGVC